MSQKTLITLVLGLVPLLACAPDSGPRHPNVVLVTIDTLRADHLGAYGYERPTSPNLDALAARGVLFEQAFAAMPTTVPSHASMLLGTWPRVHGSRSNFHRISNDGLPYLPSILKREGYATAAFLSMRPLEKHLAPLGGFDVMKSPDVKVFASSEDVIPDARQWVGARGDDEPFFLWLHLWDPHGPYRHHPELMPRINGDFHGAIDEERQLASKGFEAASAYTPEERGALVDLYDNEIAHVDQRLATLLDGLDLEETVVVVTSDHGETLLDLHEDEGYAFDHGEFLHDHQLRVPLIVAGPSVSGGRRVSEPVSLVDLMPTLLDLAGIDTPSSVDGVTLAPVIEGAAPSRGASVIVQRRYYDGGKTSRPFLAGDQFGVRGDEHKLLFSPQLDTCALLRNGAETLDLSISEAEEAAVLKVRLAEWLEETSEFDALEVRPVDSGTANGLSNLGYVDPGGDEREPTSYTDTCLHRR